MRGKWIRQPQEDASVIFVHGILSSGESCWLNSNGSYWPTLLESEPTLASLGIYVFSYQTGIFSGSYRLGDIVDSVKEYLRLDDVLACKRLVFVCHSMGGIVVRKFIVEQAVELIEAKQEAQLFLIGSPSLGSSYADWLSPLAKLLGHAQADVLRFVRNNDWLKDLDKEFINLKEGGKLKIRGKELVEDKFIILKKFFGRQVVEPFAGARYFGEHYKVPDSDHFSIAKPINKDAMQHRLLCRFILDNAPQPDVVRPFVKLSWDQPWHAGSQNVLQTPQKPDMQLPFAPAEMRSTSMSAHPEWPDRAEPQLPSLMPAETSDRTSLISEPVIALAVSSEDLKDEGAAHDLIGTADADTEPTIVGLRTALGQRFGVFLPGVRVREDVTLSAGQATVTFDERTIATTDTDLPQARDADSWWPGAAAAPTMLQALLVAALRLLPRLRPNSPDLARSEVEARTLMLADRMPCEPLAEQLRSLLTAGVDPVSAVATLRLPSVDNTDKIALWGNEEWRSLLLLDRASEAALLAGVIPGIGLSVAPQLFVKLTRALRKHLEQDEQPPRPPDAALVVRDPVLRPLVRGLLQENFPDLPVLALSETDTEHRMLMPLDEHPMSPR